MNERHRYTRWQNSVPSLTHGLGDCGRGHWFQGSGRADPDGCCSVTDQFGSWVVEPRGGSIIPNLDITTGRCAHGLVRFIREFNPFS